MKSFINSLLILIVVFSLSISALAGSIPEDLLHSDDAEIFFGEVVAYHPNKENPDIEVSPVKVVKGAVKRGVKLTYYNPNPMGNLNIKPGNVYLFTYFDENNPTDIFEVTSYDTSTLKLKNVEGDMWERFERYLNEGRYLDAEHTRLDKQNDILPVEGEDIPFEELLGVAKEDANEVTVFYEGEAYEIDPDEFYRVIDGIVLTDIKDVPLEEKRGDQFVFPNGMYITVNGLDGYAFITYDCKVDKYGYHFSRLPIGTYTMKFIDRAKIMALFAEDDYKLPPLEGPHAGKIFRYGVLLAIIAIIVAVIIVKRKKR